MRGLSSPLCAFVLLGGVASAAVQGDSLGADWGPQQGQARACVRAGKCVALKEVVAAVGRRIPGRLLNAGLEQDAGRQVYRVRWGAADGRRVDVIVDAASGQIVREEGR